MENEQRLWRASFLSTLAFLFDLAGPVAAWTGAFLLRFNFDWPDAYERHMIVGMLVLVPAHALACRVAGLYRGLWIFASLPDLNRVLRAVAASSIAALVFAVLYRDPLGVPRSVVVLYPLLLVAWMAGGRVAYRMLKEHRLYGGLVGQGKPVLVVGAGRGGAMLVRDLSRNPDWRVVGLLDDDPAKWKREVFGVPIFGAIDALPRVIAQEKARHVILALPSISTSVRRRAADLAVRAGARVFTVPAADDIISGRVSVSSIRPLEIDDLLSRETVHIDSEHVHEMLAGKTVLVTGAGGSIGGELCRQLARFDSSRLILLEHNEFSLYSLEQWFSANRPEVPIVPLIGDVKDEERLRQLFAAYRPQVIFHAAAYKHVPLMEVGNAWQAVRNNVLGTLSVAECARDFGAERFVLISTDKAVNPTNVMGATKRLAEMACQALQASGGSTQFEIVRFGNVLGSAGSVIPKFQAQIAKGGPITVTHPEITRYFMSIPEAAQLVLQAAAMGTGGEIFVLDMGEPVRIVDLARNMIHLSGYSESDIRIEFTGLRPGEKLYEELLADAEQTRETPHPKLRIARSRPVDVDFLASLRSWLEQSAPADDATVRKDLAARVPEYTPFLPRQAPALRVVMGKNSAAGGA
ncbi:MAG: polysaccharide biosynthesis protein [Burkholderiaceae bacterium]|nr:polysaccharide biosynthesis protein [Burkholderiaceae bacterium]